MWSTKTREKCEDDKSSSSLFKILWLIEWKEIETGRLRVLSLSFLSTHGCCFMSLITTCMTQFFRYLEITYSLYAANQRATISKEALDPPGSSGEAWQSKRWIGIADADSKCAKAIWKSGVRSDERRILLFFLPWLVSRCNFFFFFSLLITVYDKHARSHY